MKNKLRYMLSKTCLICNNIDTDSLATWFVVKTWLPAIFIRAVIKSSCGVLEDEAANEVGVKWIGY
jgi:hypothetical protein